MNKKILCFATLFLCATSVHLYAQEKKSISLVDSTKNAYTAAVREILGSDLERVSTTNILNALSILEPSFILLQENEYGSDPIVPSEVRIRSVNFTKTERSKSPLVVIDGVESDLQMLKDLSVFDIEVIRIYKDAMSIYGEQAANGVIDVKRKVPKDGKINASYHFVGEIDFANLSSYSVSNRKDASDYTNWMKKPLRTAFSHQHYLNVSGRASGLAYQLTANYDGTNGVMKEDFRNNGGVGLYLSYNLKDKLIVTARGQYNENSLQETPYGDFASIATLNTSESPFDENGEYKPLLANRKLNPLYEVGLSSFAKGKGDDYAASLDLKWNVVKNLSINGFGYVSGAEAEYESYKSPQSGVFASEQDPFKRGSYHKTKNDLSNYLLRLNISYLFDFNTDDAIHLRLNAGGEMRNNELSAYTYSILGVGDNDLDKIGNRSTSTVDVKDKITSFTSSVNFKLYNVYLDGSFRLSDPVQFGEKDKSASFWNMGAGWRMERESWFTSELFTQLNLRASYGSVGSLLNRYTTLGVNQYGVDPVTKWNIGLTASLKRFLILDLNYYNESSDDLLSIYLPGGLIKNYSERENKGFELFLSSNVIERAVAWNLSLNALFNKDKIVSGSSNHEMPSVPSTNPKCIGAFSSYLTYKAFSLNISLQYSLGGEIYATSLVDKVENQNPLGKSFADRWEKENGGGSGTSSSRPVTTRVLEKADYLNLSYINFGYKLTNDKLGKIGLSQLDFGVSLNNIAHFTKTERTRGTSYPFARGVSFSLGARF